jgi:Ca2+-binding EF-hand superfamily protein
MVVVLAVILGGADAARASDELLATILAESDADGDGKLARSEAPVSILLYFDRADSDKNGSIDNVEARQFDLQQVTRPRRPTRPAVPPSAEPRGAVVGGAPEDRAKEAPRTARSMIEVLDRNGDKKLSPDEFPPQHRDAFVKFDLDGSGHFDLKEAEEIDARRRNAEASDERGPKGGRTVARTVELMDTDGDGLLQKREAPLQMQRAWERFDLNGDGAVDMQEATTPRKPSEGS